MLVSTDFETIRKGILKESIRSMVSMIDSMFDTSITAEVYADEKSTPEYLQKPVIVFRMMGLTGLIFIDGKLKSEEAKEFLEITVSTETSVTPVKTEVSNTAS